MKNPMLSQKIQNLITKHSLITPGSTIIVGLSGGPDSVALLHVLKELKPELNLNLIAAHLDHGWRAESEKDAQFCRELCDQWGVRLITQKLSEIKSQAKFNGSREEFARRMRRQFFEGLMDEHGASAIALGHHADDQIETFFIRLIRGASLTGLTGMRAQYGAYIRPLLNCSKQEILTYLNDNKIAYLTDPTNTSDEYLRNRIRNKLLPIFAEIDSRAQNNLLQAIDRLQQTDEYLTVHTKEIWQQIAMQEGDAWCVDSEKLLAQQKSMRQRLLLHWLVLERVPFVPTQNFFAEIERFLKHPGSKTHCIHERWGIQKNNQAATIITY